MVAPKLGKSGVNTTEIIAVWSGSQYDVRGDLDLDGDVDSADESLVGTVTQEMGRGSLSSSSIRNTVGYSGMQLDRRDGAIWIARNRRIDAEAGRWISRDPIGYVDGLSVYAYVSAAPMVGLDPLGLATLTRNTVTRRKDSCGLMAGSWQFRLDSEVGAICGVGIPGYVVQEIKASVFIVNLAGCETERTNADTEPHHFWEAFMVMPRKRNSPIDSWTYASRFSVLNPAAGIVQLSGKAKFFCYNLTGDLEQAWGFQDAMSGAAPSTKTMPEFWNDASAILESGEPPGWGSFFDCCGETPWGLWDIFPLDLTGLSVFSPLTLAMLHTWMNMLLNSAVRPHGRCSFPKPKRRRPLFWRWWRN